MTEEGTITPEIRIQALEEALATETERVQKLFAAYEGQEKDLMDSRAEIEVLEKEIIEREIEKETQEAEQKVRWDETSRIVSEKDGEISNINNVLKLTVCILIGKREKNEKFRISN